MRIEVSAVGAGDAVSFRCGQGEGAGVWRADESPAVGGIYEVEVEVEEDIRLRPGGGSGFRLDGDAVVVGGVLRFTDDGAAYLEVAGSPVLLDLAEDAPVGAGEAVSLTVPRSALHLFPFVV